MNTMHSQHKAGRNFRPGMTFIATSLLLLALPPARGADMVATITGVLVTGYDQFHLFGGAPIKGSDKRDLAGMPFTLVYTFDDAKGRSTPPPGYCANSGSGITGEGASSPGTATLTVGGGTVVVGTRKDSHSSAWRSIDVLCSQSQISFEVHEGNGGWANGKNMVNVTMTPTKGTRSLTQNPDWRAPVTTTSMDNNGGFFLSKEGDFRHESRGVFDVKKLIVSGPKLKSLLDVFTGGR